MDLLQALCRLLFEHVDPVEAEPWLKQLVRLAPRDASAWHNLGTVYRRSGRARQAVRAYRRSLRHRPDSAATYLQLGYALRDSGAQSAARAAWEEALRLRPEDPAVLEALAVDGLQVQDVTEHEGDRVFLAEVVRDDPR